MCALGKLECPTAKATSHLLCGYGHVHQGFTMGGSGQTLVVQHCLTEFGSLFHRVNIIPADAVEYSGSCTTIIKVLHFTMMQPHHTIENLSSLPQVNQHTKANIYMQIQIPLGLYLIQPGWGTKLGQVIIAAILCKANEHWLLIFK